MELRDLLPVSFLFAFCAALPYVQPAIQACWFFHALSGWSVKTLPGKFLLILWNMNKSPTSGHLKSMLFMKIKITHHKVQHFKVYNSMGFSIVTELWSHHRYLILEHFYHSLFVSGHSHSPSSWPLAITNLLCISMNFLILYISVQSYKCGLLCLAFFTWQCFQGSFRLQHASILHSYLWLNNIPWYGYTIFVIDFINWWIFGLFPIFDSCEYCVAMNVHV